MKIRYRLVGVLAAAAAMLLAPGTAHASQGSWPDNPVYIKTFSSQKCVQPITLLPDGAVVQEPCVGASWQRWRATNVNGQGYVMLVNQATGFCLDLAVNSPEEIGNGTPTQDSVCSDQRPTQRWNKVDGSRAGYSMIFNFAAQTSCLDLKDRSSADGATIQLWSCKFLETAQEFKVTIF